MTIDEQTALLGYLEFQLVAFVENIATMTEDEELVGAIYVELYSILNDMDDMTTSHMQMMSRAEQKS